MNPVSASTSPIDSLFPFVNEQSALGSAGFSQGGNPVDKARSTDAGALVFIKIKADLPRSTQTGMLGTCRQIYNEAIAGLYEKSCFVYHPWESILWNMRRSFKGIFSDSDWPASPQRRHLDRTKKTEVPLHYLTKIKEIHLVFEEHNHYYDLTPKWAMDVYPTSLR